MSFIFFQLSSDVSSCVVVTNVLDYVIVVSVFEFQSRYYVHYQNNTLKKSICLFNSLKYYVNSTYFKSKLFRH